VDSRESSSGLICSLLPVIMTVGVQAEIRIDRDRERNEALLFAEFVLKCRVVECVWSRFFASQVRCRAKGYGIVLKLCQCLSKIEDHVLDRMARGT